MARLVITAQLWGRPYVAPPDLPPERARALRGAFQATMRDPALLAEAKKMSFDIGPLSGEEMAGLIAGLYASPAESKQGQWAGYGPLMATFKIGPLERTSSTSWTRPPATQSNSLSPNNSIPALITRFGAASREGRFEMSCFVMAFFLCG